MATEGATIVWWTPEAAGGIRAYAEALHPSVREACDAAGFRMGELVTETDLSAAPAALARRAPDVVHVQHEHGLFYGGKRTPFTRFAGVLRELRERLPSARVVVTAHTVYPVGQRVLVEERPLVRGAVQRVLDRTAVPFVRRVRDRIAFGAVDAVIVHSALQEPFVRSAGAGFVRTIPMFVPPTLVAAAPPDRATPELIVFGYSTPVKGQDIAIAALAAMRTPARLVLAGGARLPRHDDYADRCAALAVRLGVAGRVTVTGYVPESEIAARFAAASLVLAPFRDTTGSFTLARAFAQGAAVLASDLPLNAELASIEPGAPALFRAGDAADCAHRADEILGDPARIAAMRAASSRHAAARTAEVVAAAHVACYRDVLVSGPRDGTRARG